MPLPIAFDGRVVIVTGAGKPLGLGAGYARLLAARGARVVVNDVIDPSDVVDEIRAAGGEALADLHDISTDAGALGLVESAVEAYGAVDAVVNNAGVAPQVSFPEMPLDVFDRTLRVHVFGSFSVTRHAWPYLVRSGHGRVVMVTSKAALWGSTPGLAAYGTAKAAVLGLTRQLSVVGKPDGVLVNAISPTAITSPNHPRLAVVAAHLGAHPTDPLALARRSTALVAHALAWLCHPGCSVSGEFVTAQAGHVGLLTFATTRGIDDAELTCEVVRDQWATIADPTALEVVPPFPENPFD
jgi:NAD(P)-dependent dehydrogenase (short-subunit alcohol dehydrogenase family)